MQAERQSEGFTIVEVTIAMVIVALLATGVVSALSVSHVTDRSSRDLITANHIAQDVMESIEVTPYTGLLALDDSSVVDGSFTATTSCDLVAIGLIRVTVLVTCDDNPDVNIELVTLSADAN